MTSQPAGQCSGSSRHALRQASRHAARRAIPVLHALLFCLLLAGPAIPAAQANGASEAVEHVVVVWLKDPGNAEHRRRIIAESAVLREIPGVTGLRMGEMIPSDRPIVDSTFDVALIVSFADRAAMQHYLSHPVHVELVGKTLKPLVEKIRVYDFQ